jgi:Ca2+-binding RTX toxin-like protein
VTGQGDTGLLGTAPASILGGLGVQDVTNDGTVIGDVILGDGNDSFDTIGGVLKGKIYGGTGNDTFSIDNNKLKIVELVDEGTDTVRSTVSYTLADNLERLYLLGSKDVNATGNAGDNTLKGNSGDNVLKGLGGADTFYFGTKGGHDTIADLETGVDKINLSNWKGIADFDGVLSHAKNHGDDVWVTLGEDILVIEDHHKGDLVTGDFAF